MKKFRIGVLFFSLVFCFCSSKLNAQAQPKTVNIKSFGAKADGRTDDSDAFIAAAKAGSVINLPAGTYLFKKQVLFRNLTNKKIMAHGAVIINSDNAHGMIRFDNCDNISIEGGRWTRKIMPKSEGPSKQEHTFTFETCNHLNINNITIDRSPQMGICMMNVIDAVISNNTIRNCFRDGIYAHYSAKLTYLNNHLSNIKDDAMSIHDYGLQEQKGALHKAGYTQAGHSLVKGNTATQCYQGFSSIGCDGITIINNKFSRTVNAGIAVFNSETMFKGSTAIAKNITISNNLLSYTDDKQVIMGVTYLNKGQLSSGRCAIFVAVNDASNYILRPASRLNNIVITYNKVINGYANGVYLAQVDHLLFQHNTFIHCNITPSIYTTQTIEIKNCNNLINTNNTVTE